MAFDNSISLVSDLVTYAFVCTSRNAQGVDYVTDDSTASEQLSLRIRHNTAGPSSQKGQAPVRRHNVQFEKSVFNADLAKPQRTTMNFTFTEDPGGGTDLAGSPVLLMDLLKDFLDSTVMGKLSRNEA